MPSSPPSIPEPERHDETPFEDAATVQPAAGPSPAALSLTLLVLAAITFRGNQLAMATGLTTLRHLKDNNIADKTAAQGEWLKGKLAEMQKRYPVIGHVRGLGLMIGIEIVKPNEAPDHMGCYPADGELSALLQKKCFEAGLILERGGRHGCVLRLLPSLLISNAELEIFFDKFEQALLAAGVKPV